MPNKKGSTPAVIATAMLSRAKGSFFIPFALIMAKFGNKKFRKIKIGSPTICRNMIKFEIKQVISTIVARNTKATV